MAGAGYRGFGGVENLSAEFLSGTNIVLLYSARSAHRTSRKRMRSCVACVARELTLANCFGPDK